MDAFELLRKQAAQKRDAHVKAARAEFWRTVVAIKALRQRLDSNAPKPPVPNPKSLMVLLRENIPHDRLFSAADAIALMADADPERRIRFRTIRPYLERLEKKGIVHKIRRGTQGVFWAAADYAGPLDLSSTRFITEVAAEALHKFGPLTSLELVVALRAGGYRTDAPARALLNNVATSLRRNRLFRKDGKRWSLKSALASP
ncbi:MAG TPA: hypothetical protein VMJ32_18415 [Pirellulales bacterium]|nr:hypothetical protein [Pirellulales bacterium]